MLFTNKSLFLHTQIKTQDHDKIYDRIRESDSGKRG